jgi:hypothetical protein
MADGYDEAKKQRNWAERLGETIPGFRGYQDRELRREVDKQQREFLSDELVQIKGKARDKARNFADLGQIEPLDIFDRVDRRLEGLSQAIRFADYGSTGLFDPVKIGEEELQKLYQYDLSVIEDISRLADEVSAVPESEKGEVAASLKKVLGRLDALDEKWAGRRRAISKIVQTSATGEDE